jgi:ABC-2 type transport system ATP-binding protein
VGIRSVDKLHMKSTLSLKKISKSFKSNKVLHNISLELKAGEIIGLIGKSGCGKSTLIKIMVGFHKPTSGKIFLDNTEITDDIHTMKQLVGYTTQEGSFYEKLSVYENMRYYANLYNVPQKEKEKRIKELLEAVELSLSKNTLAADISGGMKRRLDFALSLIHNPKIVILDEPTTGLDPSLVDNFWRIVQKVVKEDNIAVLVSTHILSEVKLYCSKVAVMNKGEINVIKEIHNDTNVKKLFKEKTQ